MELSVTDLACQRGGALVLQNLNFVIPSGRALILRGRNGAGKTTLLRTLAGLQPPSCGHIKVPPDSIIYSSHSDGVKDMLTVAENLMFWGNVFQKPYANAARQMNLDGLLSRPAHSLSAGQKRRLGLARLCISDRPIWLLDEPTISLDAASVALFEIMLRLHLQNGGMAIIATHVDCGVDDMILDLGPFRPVKQLLPDGFDEAFL
ncbi:heme ABC exporter ATP-binding protein CcmA [Falsirhodobacter sp. alg1]|uniref:heme ABC exporter ATP-binding protein CcmA n=1 Tax=Falsirhodobacter sp. alg1 TaxID=1472418 RepID=UPI0005EE516C|nr:heme ABC exporter ATP-binding protein CcmA [Falsirhodobacter sp. alg1]